MKQALTIFGCFVVATALPEPHKSNYLPPKHESRSYDTPGEGFGEASYQISPSQEIPFNSFGTREGEQPSGFSDFPKNVPPVQGYDFRRESGVKSESSQYQSKGFRQQNNEFDQATVTYADVRDQSERFSSPEVNEGYSQNSAQGYAQMHSGLSENTVRYEQSGQSQSEEFNRQKEFTSANENASGSPGTPQEVRKDVNEQHVNGYDSPLRNAPFKIQEDRPSLSYDQTPDQGVNGSQGVGGQNFYEAPRLNIAAQGANDALTQHRAGGYDLARPNEGSQQNSFSQTKPLRPVIQENSARYDYNDAYSTTAGQVPNHFEERQNNGEHSRISEQVGRAFDYDSAKAQPYTSGQYVDERVPYSNKQLYFDSSMGNPDYGSLAPVQYNHHGAGNGPSNQQAGPPSFEFSQRNGENFVPQDRYSSQDRETTFQGSAGHGSPAPHSSVQDNSLPIKYKASDLPLGPYNTDSNHRPSGNYGTPQQDLNDFTKYHTSRYPEMTPRNAPQEGLAHNTPIGHDARPDDRPFTQYGAPGQNVNELHSQQTPTSYDSSNTGGYSTPPKQVHEPSSQEVSQRRFTDTPTQNGYYEKFGDVNSPMQQYNNADDNIISNGYFSQRFQQIPDARLSPGLGAVELGQNQEFIQRPETGTANRRENTGRKYNAPAPKIDLPSQYTTPSREVGQQGSVSSHENSSRRQNFESRFAPETQNENFNSRQSGDARGISRGYDSSRGIPGELAKSNQNIALNKGAAGNLPTDRTSDSDGSRREHSYTYNTPLQSITAFRQIFSTPEESSNGFLSFNSIESSSRNRVRPNPGSVKQESNPQTVPPRHEQGIRRSNSYHPQSGNDVNRSSTNFRIQHNKQNSSSYSQRNVEYGSERYNKEQQEEKASAKYEFDYKVNDRYSGIQFSQTETRDGDTAQGRYHVLLPDGRLQTVHYEADSQGYRPKISYAGEANDAGGSPPGRSQGRSFKNQLNEHPANNQRVQESSYPAGYRTQGGTGY